LRRHIASGIPEPLRLSRLILCAPAVLLLAGCGSSSTSGPRIERAFDVAWRDHASAQDVAYRTQRIVFHDGRWSVRMTITNRSDEPLFQATWRVGESWRTWNGPALVYSGLDVLGARRLIYVAADREEPELPFPLAPGASWTGTVGGALPARPALPHGSDIWVRYPILGIGAEWDGATPSLALQVISEKGVRL
jgi:hypothetical protein